MTDLKFDTPDDILMHYGKKGMRWGVVNEDDTSGTDKSAEKIAKAASKTASRNERAKKYDARADERQKNIDRIHAISQY